VGEDGVLVVNDDVLHSSGLTPAEMDALEEIGRAELLRRVGRLRGEQPRLPLEDRVAIVVDDGIATGATARAACLVARAHGARSVVLAVPVASHHAVTDLRRVADEVVCLETPFPFWAVGQDYRDFNQVTDGEVADLLARARTRHATAQGPGGPFDDPFDDPSHPREVRIEIDRGATQLAGLLTVPQHPVGLILFAHGSGSSRFSPRNRLVARRLNEARLGTLLLDLLTPEEDGDRALVFDIGLLSGRLAQAAAWLHQQPGLERLPLGIFGASTGAAAALRAACDPRARVSAVVSRGGRPDLAAGHLTQVRAPTLLIVGGRDGAVLRLNREALSRIPGDTRLVVVPGATHLFEEPGTLDRVAELARDWFLGHLAPVRHAAS
jgi:putative phosphoribosyl transferase